MNNNFLFNLNIIFLLNYIFPIICRTLGMMYIAPIFCESFFSYKIKIIFSVIFSFFLYPYIPYNIFFIPSLIGLLIIIEEFLIGFFIGFIFKLIFVVSNFSIDIISSQIGLSFTTLVDINNRSITTIISRLINYFTYFIFLILNIHLWMISVLVQSFYSIPIGNFFIKEKFLTFIFFFSNIFYESLKLFFPVLLLIIIFNFLVLFLNRIIIPVLLFSCSFSLILLFGVFFIYFFFPVYVFYFKFLFQKILFFLLDII